MIIGKISLMRKDIFSYFTRNKTIPGEIAVIGIVLISTFVFWSPFLLRATSWFGLTIPSSNFLYIYRHYDGPLYAVVAKTLYKPELIERFILDIKFANEYFAAHLPLYPLLIRLFAPIFNYSKSTIFVNITVTLALAVFFYNLVRQFKLTKSPLALTFVFLMLPRFLIVRSVGAPESLFIMLVLLSLFFFEKKHYLLAGLFGGLSAMTKTPGVLLFPAYLLVFADKLFFERREAESRSNNLISSRQARTINWNKLFILLIPLGLISVFYFYQIQYNDFFAYFKSGDNIHLVSPFAAFNSSARWVGTAWLEDILFYFFLYLMAVITLKDFKYRSFFYFSLVFFTATIFIQHRDISRYSLPLWPMAVIAFERFFTSKKFLIGLILLLPAIYLYSWNFSLTNMLPVSDWTSFFTK